MSFESQILAQSSLRVEWESEGSAEGYHLNEECSTCKEHIDYIDYIVCHEMIPPSKLILK